MLKFSNIRYRFLYFTFNTVTFVITNMHSVFPIKTERCYISNRDLQNLVYMQISILGKGAVINTEKTTAQYRAPNLISVVLPSSTRRRKRSVSSELGLGFDISLSYDNTNFGEELKFIIYDDSCYNCNSTTTTCTILVISQQNLTADVRDKNKKRFQQHCQ